MRTLTLALLMFSAGLCRAQLPVMPMYDSGMRSLGLQLGSAQPTASHGFRQVASAGIGANILGWHYLADWVAMGAELGTNQFGQNARGKASALHAGVLARINFFRWRSWSPYLVGGIGLHSTELTISSTLNNVPVCSPIDNSCGEDQSIKGSGRSITGGVGIEAFLFQGLSLSLESRFREYKFSGTTIEALNIMFGIHVWLSKKEKRR